MSLFPEAAPYRVLARKYRPATFAGLIGQEALVTTLGNSIAANRLAQAWLLTGVRGVGKTSTARIIAKALNCIGPDGAGGPTVNPCEVCANCTAISAGQHLDVIEMDAASNTGVDDIREIIEGVRYASVSARYKIHIIDEVHMLSKNAFNALLKTLEEPPAHVKFIFATTEVNKLPATILSRCQRFDLKRIPTEMLARHFATIAEQEGVEVEPDALKLVALAADGSVRDGLSILDQAISLAGTGPVTASAVRDMLGLADQRLLMALMDAILTADAETALAHCTAAHDGGTDPEAILQGLLDLVHSLTRARLAGHPSSTRGEEETARIARWVAGVSFPALHRLWQLLLKGHGDVRVAPNPQQAAEMAILRCVHGAGLPAPEDLLRPRPADSAEGLAPQTPSPPLPARPVATTPTNTVGQICDAQALLSLFSGREPELARHLHDDVAILEVGDYQLRLGSCRRLPPRFVDDISRCLHDWTGEPWRVSLTTDDTTPTLRDQEVAAATLARERAAEDPLVKAFQQVFPGSQLLAGHTGDTGPMAATTIRRSA